jgi:tripartite ATP-independent transporter DctP family solute receptor
MTNITRRTFTALAGGTAVAAALPIRYAHAAEHTFKIGTNVPASHPLNVHLSKAAEQIKAETGGKVELQLFPNNQLGADSDMLSQLRSGALECFLLSGVNVLSTIIPAGAISGVGFAFKDYPALWNAMDGKLGAHLRGLITKGGFVVLEKIWDNGFRQITNSTKPITHPDDLRGMKIRVPVSALWLSLFKSLGASPTGLNFAEVYSALQTKVVDGQENPPAIIAAAKLYEVQKYCSVTNHMWDGWWFLINRRAWSQVPAGTQETIAKIINSNCMAQREDIAQQNIALVKTLSAAGLIFNDVDPKPFRDKLSESGYYREWKTKFGEEAWSLLEDAGGKLA